MNEKIIEKTLKAINESKRAFKDIPKDSIIDFLRQNGVDRQSTRDDIYNELSKYFNKTQQVAPVKVIQNITNSSYNVDNDTVNNDLPKKEPRKKNIFGEIKRIA